MLSDYAVSPCNARRDARKEARDSGFQKQGAFGRICTACAYLHVDERHAAAPPRPLAAAEPLADLGEPRVLVRRVCSARASEGFARFLSLVLRKSPPWQRERKGARARAHTSPGTRAIAHPAAGASPAQRKKVCPKIYINQGMRKANVGQVEAVDWSTCCGRCAAVAKCTKWSWAAANHPTECHLHGPAAKMAPSPNPGKVPESSIL